MNTAPVHDIWHYVALLRRRWWLVLSTGLVALFTGWWSQRDAVPEYAAEALLQQSAGGSDIVVPWAGTGLSDFGSHLDIIRSAEVMSPVVDSLGLQLRLHTHRGLRTRMIQSVDAERAAPRGSYSLVFDDSRVSLLAGSSKIDEGVPGDVLSGPGFEITTGTPGALEDPVEFSITNFDIAVEQLQNKLKVEQGSGPDLLWIRTLDPDPRFAADLVNVTADAYQEQRASNARYAAERTRQIIANQLADAGDSLRAVQQDVIDYQERSRLANPDAEGGALMTQLLSVDASRRQLESDVILLEGLLAGLDTSDGGGESLQIILATGGDVVPQMPDLARRLQDLEQQRSQLTGSRFGATANAPGVQALDAQISQMRSAARQAANQALGFKRTLLAEENRRYGQLRAEAGAIPGRNAVYERLEGQVEAAKGAYDNLISKYYEAQVAEGIAAGDIDVISPAAVPVLAAPSRKGFQMAFALMAGLIIGIVGALLMDQLDSRVRRVWDAERVSDLQVVGTIPNIRALSGDEMSVQIGKDAFRNLRTHLRFAAEESPQAIAVTSATPRDGKSTVAANLALTLAEQGGRILLVEADLRRPQVHRTFGLRPSPGLSDILLGRSTLEEALQKCPDCEPLDVLTCGEAVPNPTELIGGMQFEALLKELREQYDSIVLDTPPLLAVTDAALVAASVDGTLIVVRANKTDQEALENGVNQLRRLRVKLLGLVLNGVPMGRSGGYAYYPSYYPSYGAEPDAAAEAHRPLLGSGNRDQKAS